MVLDDLVEKRSHVFSLHSKEDHLSNFLKNFVFGIGIAFVPIVDQKATFFEVCLDNDFLLFSDVFDSFGQKGGNKFEDIAIDLSGEIFVKEIENSGMFGHVFVDKRENLISAVNIGIK